MLKTLIIDMAWGREDKRLSSTCNESIIRRDKSTEQEAKEVRWVVGVVSEIWREGSLGICMKIKLSQVCSKPTKNIMQIFYN